VYFFVLKLLLILHIAGHKANSGRFYFAGVVAGPNTFCWDNDSAYIIMDAFSNDKLVKAEPKNMEPVCCMKVLIEPFMFDVKPYIT